MLYRRKSVYIIGIMVEKITVKVVVCQPIPKGLRPLLQDRKIGLSMPQKPRDRAISLSMLNDPGG